jgi:hypothetical protein
VISVAETHGSESQFPIPGPLFFLSYPQEEEWTSFQTKCYNENVVEPGIEHGTSGSAARNSDH